MKHYGDITKIKGSDVEPVDIITFGSPCQDLSVAGKRAGMKSELMGDEDTTRSGLFHDAIRIIKEMREHELRSGRADVDIRPRYAIYENVPGALSSNDGADFRCVLEEMCRIKDKDAVIPQPTKWEPCGCIMGEGYSLAYRIHDAQWFGVPQRRRRVCVLIDLNGDTAPRMVFELLRKTDCSDADQTVANLGEEPEPEVQTVCESLSRDTEPSGAERKGTSTDASGSVAETGKCLNGWDVQSKHIQPEDGVAESLYAGECRGGGGESYVAQDSLSFQERAGKPGGGKGVLVQENRTGALACHPQSVVYSVDQAAGKSSCQVDKEKTSTLATTHYGAPAVAYSTQASGDRDNPSQGFIEEKAYTIPSNPMSDRMQSIVYGISPYESNGMKSDNPHSGIYEADTARTLDLNGGSPACNQGGMAVVEGFDSYNIASTGETARTIAASKADAEHIPCVVGVDLYNQTTTGEKSKTLNSVRSDADHVPSVITMDTKQQSMATQEELAATLGANAYKEPQAVVLENHPNDSRVKIREDNTFQTLSSRMGTGGNNTPMVMTEPLMVGCDMYNQELTGEVAATMNASSCGSPTASGPSVMVEEPILLESNQDHATVQKDGVSTTLPASMGEGGGYVPMVTDDPMCIGNGQADQTGFHDKVGALNCMHDQQALMTRELIVRRLTPKECERLQNFPDEWTNIGEWYDTKGKLHKESSDANRYKALGNSIALCWWQRLARNICNQLRSENRNDITLASLFDGISGFPLVFYRCGCRPVWSSEIEEFPIAVAKRHFGDDENGIKGDVDEIIAMESGWTERTESVPCLNDQGGLCMSVSDDVAGTLRSEEHGHQPLIFEPGSQADRVTVGALCARDYKGVGNQYFEEGKVIFQGKDEE